MEIRKGSSDTQKVTPRMRQILVQSAAVKQAGRKSVEDVQVKLGGVLLQTQWIRYKTEAVKSTKTA